MKCVFPGLFFRFSRVQLLVLDGIITGFVAFAQSSAGVCPWRRKWRRSARYAMKHVF